MKRVILLTILILLISSAYSFAEVPCKINYQGRLIKDNVPVNAPVNMEFKLYTQLTGGTLKKTISMSNVPVYNGLFRAVLDLEGIDWAAGETMYLEVKVGSDILTPREELSAYPYAINSHLLEGKTTDHFLDVSGSTQTKQGGLNIMGSVGIGTTSPEATLQVNGTMKIFGGWVDMTAAAGSGATQGPAPTDGFVCARRAYGGHGGANIRGYTDADEIDVTNSDSSVLRVSQATGYNDDPGISITMPVKKGYYWKVVGAGTGSNVVHWIPLGSQ